MALMRFMLMRSKPALPRLELCTRNQQRQHVSTFQRLAIKCFGSSVGSNVAGWVHAHALYACFAQTRPLRKQKAPTEPLQA